MTTATAAPPASSGWSSWPPSWAQGAAWASGRTLVEPDAVGGEPGTPTGERRGDGVLGLLEGDLPGEVTADYSITTQVRRHHAIPLAWSARATGSSVTIGDIRFLTTATCRPAT